MHKILPSSSSKADVWVDQCVCALVFVFPTVPFSLCVYKCQELQLIVESKSPSLPSSFSISSLFYAFETHIALAR